MSVGQFFPFAEQGWITYIIWIASLFLLFTLWGKLQIYQYLRQIEANLKKLEAMRDEAFRTSVKTLKKVGKLKEDPTPFVSRFTEYVFIEPTSMDPAGIVWKFDHLLDVRDIRHKEEVRSIVPNASESQLNNLENLLEASLDLNLIYKVVRHFYLLGKRTKNLLVVMQLHMQMPLIMQIAEAYTGAVEAFSKGYPIGDGAGALAAAKLMHGRSLKEIVKDTVFAERRIEGRKVIIVKSKGPGGNIGKPGEAIQALIDRYGGKVAMIVMIDAAVKLEGEKSGVVSEGVGAAIGGIGTEKYKIEEIALKYKIPMNAVLIKESIQEAISPMRKEIVEGVEEAVKVVKRLIGERTKKGDIVIVAGVGNTVGVGP